MTVERRRADSSVGEGAPERGLELGLKLAISDRSTAKEEALSLDRGPGGKGKYTVRPMDPMGIGSSLILTAKAPGNRWLEY